MGKNVIISTLPNISQNYLPKVNTSNIFANSLVYDNGTNVMVNTTATHADYTNARLVVNNTGNTYLEVRGDGGQGTIALTTSTSTTSNFPTVEIFNSADFGIVGYRPGVVSSNYIMYYELSSSTNRRLTFQTEGVTRIAIQGAGRILMGPTLPTDDGSTALQVNGGGKFSSSVTATQGLFTSSNYPLDLTANTNNYGIRLTSVQAPSLLLYSTYNTANNRNWGIFTNYAVFGDFAIAQSNAKDGDLTTGANGTARLYLRNDGNVGIGTTSPADNLHIAASEVGNVGISVQNTNASYSAQIRFLNSAGTEKAAVTSYKKIRHIFTKVVKDADYLSSKANSVEELGEVYNNKLAGNSLRIKFRGEEYIKQDGSVGVRAVIGLPEFAEAIQEDAEYVPVSKTNLTFNSELDIKKLAKLPDSEFKAGDNSGLPF